MYKICNLKRGEFLCSEGERNVIAEITHCPNVGVNFEIDGRLYHVTSIFEKEKLIGVREFTYNEEVYTEYDGDFICPYCGNEYCDAFELEDEGDFRCGKCGSESEYTREVVIQYTVSPKKKKEVIKLI